MPLEANDKLLFRMTDQPTTCPKCGSRTDFEEFQSGLQEHVCRNKECGFAFFVTE